MATTWVLLILGGLLHHCKTQSNYSMPITSQPGCASQDGFIRGASTCCSHFVFTNLYRICCTDPIDNMCYCDGKQFGTVCGATDQATEPPQYLCPGAVPHSQGRLLLAEPVTEVCEARGVVGLTTLGIQYCNAVFAKLPATNEKVLYTLTRCWEATEQSIKAGISITGVIANDSLSFDDCSIVNTTKTNNANVTKVRLSDLAAYFIEQHVQQCPNPGCLYHPQTMGSAINTTDCFIVSYGFTLKGSNELTRIAVKMADTQECGGTVPFSKCFVSHGEGSECTMGDQGAPVYCRLNTGELTLYGINAFPLNCTTDSTAFNVYPVFA